MGRNNKDFLAGNGESPKESATQEKLMKTMGQMGLSKGIKNNPKTGIPTLDLSDPNHPFNQPMFSDWNK